MLVADVGAKHADRLSAEEHDTVRREQRLQRPAEVHARPSRTGGGRRAADHRRDRQLSRRPAGRQLPRRDVRLCLQRRRLPIPAVAARRSRAPGLELAAAGSRLGRVDTAAARPRGPRCLGVVDRPPTHALLERRVSPARISDSRCRCMARNCRTSL